VIVIIVLVGSLLIFRAAGALGVPAFATWVAATRWALAAMFLFTGLAHFTKAKYGMAPMVPEIFGNAMFWVYFTGACEIAGGIGLPPLRPAILTLLADRPRYGRLTLLYGSRAPEQLLYPHELKQWSGRGLEVEVTVDSAGPEWLGHVGVVPRLLRRIELDPLATVAMLCGPEVMIRFAIAALRERGIATERIYVSMERNMQCGIGWCGHCQLGPLLLCRDGPVVGYDVAGPLLQVKEL